jgi:hypothetical protein
MWDRRGSPPQWTLRARSGSAAAAGRLLEIAVPLSDLAVPADGTARVSFFVAVYDAAGREVERHPVHAPIHAVVPDARFAAENWSA